MTTSDFPFINYAFKKEVPRMIQNHYPIKFTGSLNRKFIVIDHFNIAYFIFMSIKKPDSAKQNPVLTNTLNFQLKKFN